ncbi:Galectin [Aphelenchoides besseyi]|nr:Galectin [Aphelenchoides besseyi]KAI6200150.1 Galectin [Aphelenchoides besseyi]
MGLNAENIVIANHLHHGKWGHEHREFSTVNPGQPLRMHVEFHDKKFHININGRSFHYTCKLHSHDINRLEIRGDLVIRSLRFHHMENHLHLFQPIQSACPPQTYGQPTAYAYSPQAYPPPQNHYGRGY